MHLVILTNVSHAQYGVLAEFLLSIGKVKHDRCLYTYLYNMTYNASLICAFNMNTHHVTHPTHGP